jgi:hypothetical protein
MLWELDPYLGVVANHMEAVCSLWKLCNEYGSSIYPLLKLQVLVLLDHFSVSTNFCYFTSIHECY